MNTALEQSPLTVVDGYLVDDHGEIVGLATKQEFHVTDEKSADWVLEKLTEAKANIARNDIKRKAVLERLESLDKQERRRVEWLEAMFGPELEAFAKSQIGGQKSKTLKLTWGSLAFRVSPAKVVKSEDEEAALEWAKSECPESVRVKESFLSSAVPLDLMQRITQGLCAGGTHPAFTVKEASETFKIETGVK